MLLAVVGANIEQFNVALKPTGVGADKDPEEFGVLFAELGLQFADQSFDFGRSKIVFEL
jgi:hypothetical protein